MSTKRILTRAVEIVTFVFAAFGHFLLGIAPPEEGRLGISAGIASILAVTVLLYISALAHSLPAKKHKRRWLVAAGGFLALVVVAFPWYRSNLAKYTFAFPSSNSPNVFVRGTELTPEAKRYRDRYPMKTVQDVVADFGGTEARTLVWTEPSIRHASLILGIHYLVVTLGVATAIFCLTEGIFGRPTTPATKRPKRKKGMSHGRDTHSVAPT